MEDARHGGGAALPGVARGGLMQWCPRRECTSPCNERCSTAPPARSRDPSVQQRSAHPPPSALQILPLHHGAACALPAATRGTTSLSQPKGQRFPRQRERVEWLSGGAVVADVPDVRIVHLNGSLQFLPFPPYAYTATVHAATYACRASSAAGTILSIPVHVRAGETDCSVDEMS
ncbi:Down syndrome cell adhesion molecule [Portunus trituberculatus]|uniref:Down syndrome cell adhesion molecule n=1 Tax=Portunus trituberculatus TaxID=210409 RepID=A0A5B7FR75_PORTR|nr:Down syndrome cell adhesion molecule [Portunus trituberculatus]